MITLVNGMDEAEFKTGENFLDFLQERGYISANVLEGLKFVLSGYYHPGWGRYVIKDYSIACVLLAELVTNPDYIREFKDYMKQRK